MVLRLRLNERFAVCQTYSTTTRKVLKLKETPSPSFMPRQKTTSVELEAVKRILLAHPVPLARSIRVKDGGETNLIYTDRGRPGRCGKLAPMSPSLKKLAGRQTHYYLRVVSPQRKASSGIKHSNTLTVASKPAERTIEETRRRSPPRASFCSWLSSWTGNPHTFVATNPTMEKKFYLFLSFSLLLPSNVIFTDADAALAAAQAAVTAAIADARDGSLLKDNPIAASEEAVAAAVQASTALVTSSRAGSGSDTAVAGDSVAISGGGPP